MIWLVGLIGTLIGVMITRKPAPSLKDSSASVAGNQVSTVNLTPHLSRLSLQLKSGKRPSQWLVSGAIEEAYAQGDWKTVKALVDNFSEELPPIPDKEEVKEEAKEEEVKEAPKALEASFSISAITSPTNAATDDDWRMFVQASRVANPDFDSESAIGMFRMNKKRLAKMGVKEDSFKDPIAQYNAFEKETEQLIEEGKNLIRLHVGMPVNVDGEAIPVTMSGLLAVMRNAGTKNAEKWLDVEEDRRKFPNTTDAFKRANGCF